MRLTHLLSAKIHVKVTLGEIFFHFGLSECLIITEIKTLSKKKVNFDKSKCITWKRQVESLESFVRHKDLLSSF